MTYAILAVLTLVCSLAPAATSSAARAEELPELLPGAPLEATLAGGDTHAYRLQPLADHPLRLTVEQRGVDAVIEVFGADGGSFGVADSPLDRRGLEVFLIPPPGPAESSGPSASVPLPGPLRVEVRPRFAWAPPAPYRITATVLPASTPGERARIAAERADSRAARLYAEDTAESRGRAADAYLDAALRWRSQGDRRREARAVYCLAVLQRLLDRTREALATAERALGLWRALDDPFWEAMTLNELGLNRFHLGEGDAAEERFRQAAELFAQQDAVWGEAAARSNLCLSALVAGDLRAGVTCYDEAIEGFRKVGELPSLAVALANSGRAWDVLGEPERALESYRKALEVRRATGDRRGEAQVLNNLAVLHSNLGEWGTTLTYHRQALGVFDELEDRRWQARTLHNLGYAYLVLGDLPRARSHLERALPLRRELEDPRGEAATLNALAGLHVRQGEVEQALPLHRRALALRRETGDRRGEALALILVGRDLGELGQGMEALGHLRRALDLARDLEVRSSVALAKQELGRVLVHEGKVGGKTDDEMEPALEALREAVELRRALRDPAGEMEALFHLARAERTAGHLAAAAEHAETAIARVESLRGRVTSPDLQATFGGSRHRVYSLAVDLRMELHATEPDRGHALTAFEISERARARVLLDLLRELGGPSGLPTDLAERLRSAQRRLAARVRAQIALLDRETEDDGAESAKRRERAERQTHEALAALEEVEAERRRHNPHDAGLSAAELPTVAEVQQLLGPDTALVEYALGEQRSFVWVLTATDFAAATLPGRREIEGAALAVHRDLSTVDPQTAQKELTAAAALADTLLGPVADLASRPRLAVVPDGALHYLPFAALPWPGSREPLLVRHEMIQLPSASTLRELRRRADRRRPAEGPEIAIFADPVFHTGDSRLAAERRTAGASEATAEAVGDPDLPRLPRTRSEAEAIAALYPPQAAQPAEGVFLALDFDAGREAALGGAGRRARILHFATHGVFDAESPLISGLTLSMVDERGGRRNGFIGLHDLYGAELAADLVVLSGCETALGREIRGEGLVGLTRGFMYAGVPRVVASLWRVEDRATAELMARFYRGQWSNGLTPAAALRAAQLSIRREPRWRDPYYWAGFVIQGEWR